MTFHDSSTKIGTDLSYKFNAILTNRKVPNIQQAQVYCSHMNERQYNVDKRDSKLLVLSARVQP